MNNCHLHQHLARTVRINSDSIILTHCHGLGIISQRVVSLEYDQFLIAHLKRTFHCTLVTTLYEKSWRNNRIYLQVYPHLHTKLCTGWFSRKGQDLWGI